MTDNLTDTYIIEQILNGQQELFKELVDRYQRQIFSYLLRILNFHRQDAEDALSESFLKAYINLSTFNPSLKFFSWLCRIAHNEAVNIIKKKSKYYIVEIEDFQHFTDYNFEKPSSKDIESVLSQVGINERQILTLFYLQELSLEEISEILKITTGNVKVRLNRARNKARDIVNKHVKKYAI